ncbi:MAG: SPASM domain-containing protein [Planctomycetes bacterium]|nr:SPASM domain-containing protein [Planctomycetota bacterium]
MKVIAAITADFERTFLGLPSRLNAELRGESVIRRTIKRLQRARQPASVHLLVDVGQEATARAAVAGLEVTVETHHAGEPPWRQYVASGRKWSLDSWRGGLAGTTVYDEFVHPWLLEALARRERADAVVDVPAAAPLLDPGLLDAMVQHYAKVHEDTRLGLAQTAPGLSGIVYRTEMLSSLTAGCLPPGRTMAYQPDSPQQDVLVQSCTCATEAAISHAWGRCIADTSTAMRRLELMLDEVRTANGGGTPDALAISRWLLANRHAPLHALPDETEVEITTEDPLPFSSLRPRGPALGRGGEMDFDTFKRIVDELAVCDDRLLVLGGFGDPLLHPQWPEFIRYAREAGILGIAVRTTAVNLDDAAIDAFLAVGVDVLCVLLDAATAATYRRVHQVDAFDRVVANVNRFCEIQNQRPCPRPLVVCELTKTHDTMDEMEAFYDHWTRKTGSVVIAGPSRYAGAWPDRAVLNMAPPTRSACSRLNHRAMILADGRMTLCDQDFRGEHAASSLRQASLAQLWNGDPMTRARRLHAEGRYETVDLCRACDEWHRP